MISRCGRVLQVTCILLGPICGFTPLGLAPLLHATGLALLLAYRADHGRWPVPDRRIAFPLLLLAGWIALSCLWANAGLTAWKKLPELLAIGASALVIPIAIRDLSAKDVELAQRMLVFSVLGGLLLCLGDIALGSPVKRLHWRWSGPVPVNAYDREIVCFALFLWPFALIRYREGFRESSLVLLGIYAAGILFLQSHSAMLGMILGMITLPIAWYAPRIVRLGLTAICAAGFALCIPIALLMAKWGLDQRDSLQFSFRDRIQIWHFTADRILNWPLVGLGLEGSRAIPLDGAPLNFMPLEGNKPALHPHDFFLQIWLELGIVGVGLTLFLIVRLVQAIPISDRPTRAFTYAAAVSYLGIAAFAFGIWQGWWMSALVLLVSITTLASRRIDGT